MVDDREIKLGKGWVVARLHTLLQANRLHLPKSEGARILAEELMAYEVKVAEDTNERYGMFKVGKPGRPRDGAGVDASGRRAKKSDHLGRGERERKGQAHEVAHDPPREGVPRHPALDAPPGEKGLPSGHRGSPHRDRAGPAISSAIIRARILRTG